VYIAVAIHIRTFYYYLLAIALAPLALLRTDAAIKWALFRYRDTNVLGHRLLIQWSYQRRHRSLEIASILFVFVVTIAWGFINRIVSVFYWFLRKPVEALREMPKNWLRQAFCVDLYAPPEIVPGEDTYALEIGLKEQSGRFQHLRLDPEILTFRKVFLPKSLRAHFEQLEVREALGAYDQPPEKEWGLRLLRLAITLLLFVPAFLVPLAYRTSVKATCIVYAPFVWVAGITVGSTDPLKIRLDRIVSGQSEKYRRRFAGLVLIMAITKLAMHFGWIDAKEAAHHVFGSAKLVSEFLEPLPWPWWQIALVVDALVTFGLLLLGDAFLSRIDSRGRSYKRLAAQVIAIATYARAILAVVVVSYLVATAVIQVSKPAIRAPAATGLNI